MAPRGQHRSHNRFDFRTVGDQLFRCGASYGGVGMTGSTITPADFRMYVSNVALIDEFGRAVPMALVEDGHWQARNVALLDFEDGSGPCAGGSPGVRDSITGNIPPGRYRGLVFTLGVPPDQNISPAGIALPPLNVPALAMAPAFLVAQACRYVDLDGPLLQRLDREMPIRFESSLMHPPDAALWG